MVIKVVAGKCERQYSYSNTAVKVQYHKTEATCLYHNYRVNYFQFHACRTNIAPEFRIYWLDMPSTTKNQNFCNTSQKQIYLALPQFLSY